MAKRYIGKNVWDATQERIKYIFDTFDNIYVSFSGGKDSGMVLNLILDYKRKHGITKKIGVFHQDFESQYEETTKYVEKMFVENLDDIEPYWCCVPMGSRCAVSNYQMYWYPWDDQKKDQWVRPMPNYPWVINQYNHPFDFYEYKMSQEDFYAGFEDWYAKTHPGKTICLLGIRTDESLNRFRAVNNQKKLTFGDNKWTTKKGENYCHGYPIYDWSAEDIWIANAREGYPYNKLYDLFYKAGLSIYQMRVASPYQEYAKGSLNLYRVIEPQTWIKVVSRVQGANFGAIYGDTKALGAKSITLPKGHTWRSYVKFLLATLPNAIRDNYIEKFKVSIRFWWKKGGCLDDETIKELEEHGYKIRNLGRINKISPKQQVVFLGTPDCTDDIMHTAELPSWKRMAITILKNDHLCKYMGFAQTQKQINRQRELVSKYKDIGKKVNK